MKYHIHRINLAEGSHCRGNQVPWEVFKVGKEGKNDEEHEIVYCRVLYSIQCIVPYPHLLKLSPLMKCKKNRVVPVNKNELEILRTPEKKISV